MVYRYSFTKLLQVFIARRLATLPLAEGVVVNAVHPNLCKTSLGRNAPRFINWLFFALGWKAGKGAKCVSSLYEEAASHPG